MIIRMGRKAPDDKHQFGHARIETLSSPIIGLALIGTALYLGLEPDIKKIFLAEISDFWLFF